MTLALPDTSPDKNNHVVCKHTSGWVWNTPDDPTLFNRHGRRTQRTQRTYATRGTRRTDNRHHAYASPSPSSFANGMRIADVGYREVILLVVRAPFDDRHCVRVVFVRCIIRSC